MMIVLIIAIIGGFSVVALGEHSFASLVVMGDHSAEFEPVWKELASSRPIKCSATGREYSGLAKPSLFIIDGFLCPWLPIIRSHTPSPPVPVLTWYVGFSAGIFPTSLPEKYGGWSHIALPEFTQEETMKGRPNPPTGKIVRLRGLPEMYDWELYPQLVAGATEISPGIIFKGVHNFTK
jgi:hypothetical protein